MKILGYMVRWVDTDKVHHEKEYDDIRLARKATDWLKEKGADRIDIAVIVKEPKKEETE